MSADNKHHHHGHNHEDFDPGVMYKEEWVQELIRKLQKFLQSNIAWLGLKSKERQRVLDYACGHGTISLALVNSCSETTFQGLDNHPKQVGRYNDEACKMFGEQHDRMHAIEGDLSNPSSTLNDPHWFNFDVAIMSLALHHVSDPVDMLSKLKERLRKGGTLVVVEFTQPGDDSKDIKTSNVNEADMVEVVGGQKIWPGFTPDSLGGMLGRAGFEDVDVKLQDETVHFPEHIGGGLAGTVKKLMYVKAIAP